jgi:glycogen debranching enzyme
MDSDGLLAAGEPGQQLTWMDARVGNREITPRIGKPVEVQALWLNALHMGAVFDRSWSAVIDRAARAFDDRFWNPERQYLLDVVDVEHRAGAIDPTMRPNQILAAGGLPRPLVSGARAAAVVAAVERELWTPMGLRSLAPGEAGYVGRYGGSSAERDGAYHQGTVWPWLLGPFVDAWLTVHGRSAEARAEADRRFVEPLRTHVDAAGIGHVSEIADADTPVTPRGCPWQAWSLGELVRAERMTAARLPDAPSEQAPLQDDGGEDGQRRGYLRTT